MSEPRTVRNIAHEHAARHGWCGFEAEENPTAFHSDECDAFADVVFERDAEIALSFIGEKLRYTAQRETARAALEVATKALEDIDFGRVSDDGYCNACEECASENPCVHRFAHDALEAISRLAAPPDGGTTGG